MRRNSVWHKIQTHARYSTATVWNKQTLIPVRESTSGDSVRLTDGGMDDNSTHSLTSLLNEFKWSA